MAWSDVTDKNDTDRVLIDPPFCVKIRRIQTINIQQAADALTNGQPVEIVREREEIRLWNGALFVGCFEDRDEVQQIVRQLRQKAMNRR